MSPKNKSITLWKLIFRKKYYLLCSQSVNWEFIYILKYLIKDVTHKWTHVWS